jgi:hypothetical protein
MKDARNCKAATHRSLAYEYFTVCKVALQRNVFHFMICKVASQRGLINSLSTGRHLNVASQIHYQ